MNPHELKNILNQCIKKLVDRMTYYPLFLTDKDNNDVLSQLIELQYKQIIEKGTQSAVEALKITRKKKYDSIVKYLESRQDINAVDKDGNTLLHLYALKGDVAQVKELLAKGADVNIKNKSGYSPICSLTRYNKVAVIIEMMQLLLKNNAKVELPALSAAIGAGNLDALSLLLAHSCFDEVPYVDFFATTKKAKPWYVNLMYRALQTQQPIEFLMVLKEYGANFNRRDDRDMTLLSEVIKYLPSPAETMRMMRELHIALQGTDECRIPERLDNTHKQLMQANCERSEKAVKLIHYLLDNNALPMLVNEDGTTPLYQIILEKDLGHLPDNGYEALLEKLVAKGADVNAITNQNLTPLHAAVTTNDETALHFLLKHNVQLDVKNNQGDTPLHLAIQRCFVNSTKALMEAGAQTNMLNKDGLSLLELLHKSYQEKRKAMEERHREVKARRDKESRALWLTQEALDEIKNFDENLRKNLAQLDANYQDTKTTLRSTSSTVLPGL